MRPLLAHLAWLKNLLCYMIHYGTNRGAVVGVRGAVVGVRGAAVGNIGIPTYVISRGAVVRQPMYEGCDRGLGCVKVCEGCVRGV